MGRRGKKGKSKKNKVKQSGRDNLRIGRHATRNLGHQVSVLFFSLADSYSLDENILKSTYQEGSDQEGNHAVTISRKNNLGYRIKQIETEYFLPLALQSSEQREILSGKGLPHVSDRIYIKFRYVLEDKRGNVVENNDFIATDISDNVRSQMIRLLKTYKDGGVLYHER